MVKRVRIAFVGCGMMGQMVHLPNFLKLDNCEVVALCELREKLEGRWLRSTGFRDTTDPTNS